MDGKPLMPPLSCVMPRAFSPRHKTQVHEPDLISLTKSAVWTVAWSPIHVLLRSLKKGGIAIY